MQVDQGVVNDGLPVVVTGVLVPDLITTAPIVGQSKVAVTGTAVQLSSGVLTNGVILTAKTTNTAPLVIGGSSISNTVDGTGNGFILEPGAMTSVACDNVNRIYFNGTSGDIISYCGS